MLVLRKLTIRTKFFDILFWPASACLICNQNFFDGKFYVLAALLFLSETFVFNTLIPKNGGFNCL